MIPQGLDHNFGECLIHEPTRICHLNIPKCASTSMKDVLTKVGFEHVDNFVKPEGEGWWTFAIRRDPIERLRSGILEICERRNWNVLDFATHYLTDPFVDEHLIDQDEFVPPWNKVDTWVPFQQVNVVVPVLLARFGVDIVEVPHLNVGAMNGR